MVKQDDSNALEESMGGDMSSLLPVLYVEDGKAILRFSEIFGVHEPLKAAGKRDRRYIIPKGVLKNSLGLLHFSVGFWHIYSV